MLGPLAARAVLPTPPIDLAEEINQLHAAAGQPVVGPVVALVMLDKVLGAQVAQGVGQRTGVHDIGAYLRHRVVQLGVAQWPFAEGGQDRNGQLPLSQVEYVFQVVRQRSSPPPESSAPRSRTTVYEVAQLFGERLAWRKSLSIME